MSRNFILQHGILSIGALFSFTCIHDLEAQKSEDTHLKEFKIEIEMHISEIKLRSITGSAWRELSFSDNQDKPQAIDEYGMTELNKGSTQLNDNLSDYLFTVTRTDDGITLHGIEGTAWNNLVFSLRRGKRQIFDQTGMTE